MSAITKREETEEEEEDEDDDTPLKHAARRKDLMIGTAVMPDLLESEPDYAATIQREFNAVVVEHHMKWTPLLVSGRGEYAYDFTPSDLIVDWALSKGMRAKGHTLVWHVTSPVEEFLREKSPAQLREAMRRHIHTVCGHFYGRIECWDVVNEALAPNGEFAPTLFFERFGRDETFIDECFRWAKAADPRPKLLYNDNKVEGLTRKSDAMFGLCRRMRERGAPLDGVGFQAHYDASGRGEARRPATPYELNANIKRYADLGLTVNVSEMDVRVAKLTRLSDSQRSECQSYVYRETLRGCVEEPNFEGVTFWGFTDKHTWCDAFYGKGESPLLFDRDYKRKAAYYAVRKALRGSIETTTRRRVSLVRDWNENGNGWFPVEEEEGNDTKRAREEASVTTTDKPDWELPSS